MSRFISLSSTSRILGMACRSSSSVPRRSASAPAFRCRPRAVRAAGVGADLEAEQVLQLAAGGRALLQDPDDVAVKQEPLLGPRGPWPSPPGSESTATSRAGAARRRSRSRPSRASSGRAGSGRADPARCAPAPARPFSASVTVQPSFSRIVRVTSRVAGSSSTSRTGPADAGRRISRGSPTSRARSIGLVT